jgi:hypothetical protein
VLGHEAVVVAERTHLCVAAKGDAALRVASEVDGAEDQRWRVHAVRALGGIEMKDGGRSPRPATFLDVESPMNASMAGERRLRRAAGCAGEF